MVYAGLLYPEPDAAEYLRVGVECQLIGPLFSRRDEAVDFLREEMVDVHEHGLPVVPVLLTLTKGGVIKKREVVRNLEDSQGRKVRVRNGRTFVVGEWLREQPTCVWDAEDVVRDRALAVLAEMGYGVNR